MAFAIDITTTLAHPLSQACVARGRFVKPAAEQGADDDLTDDDERSLGWTNAVRQSTLGKTPTATG